MKSFALIISFFTLLIYRRDWLILREQLAVTYKQYINDSNYRPSVLARQLLISGEDHRYFIHGGIDLVAICRAMWRRLISNRWEGASTIEMQIVRVISGRYERTLLRKIREMALSTLVTNVIPKSILPAIYLRIGYYGWRMNGFSAACRQIGSNDASLSSFETARLVARLKYPQPHHMSEYRRQQIDIRAKHLLNLYIKHNQRKTYLGLFRKPIYATI